MIPIFPKEMTIHDHEMLERYYENLVEAGLVIAVISMDRFKAAALNGFDPEMEIDDEN